MGKPNVLFVLNHFIDPLRGIVAGQQHIQYMIQLIRGILLVLLFDYFLFHFLTQMGLFGAISLLLRSAAGAAD